MKCPKCGKECETYNIASCSPVTTSFVKDAAQKRAYILGGKGRPKGA